MIDQYLVSLNDAEQETKFLKYIKPKLIQNGSEYGENNLWALNGYEIHEIISINL